MSFRFLDEFRCLFEGRAYLHRRSNLGDWVAQFLFEDLYHIGHSRRLTGRIDKRKSVINTRNKAHGVKHRRGDGSFGTIIPGDEPIEDRGFAVARGPIANIEIGVEVKILAKAMIKQIDRVMGDLRKQAGEFRKSDKRAITVGVIGVNHAPQYRSFEGDRTYITDGKKYAHPMDEAGPATDRLITVKDAYDEMIVLPFLATNLEPFPFSWVDENETRQDYASLLVRVSGLYEQHF